MILIWLISTWAGVRQIQQLTQNYRSSQSHKNASYCAIYCLPMNQKFVFDRDYSLSTSRPIRKSRLKQLCSPCYFLWSPLAWASNDQWSSQGSEHYTFDVVQSTSTFHPLQQWNLKTGEGEGFEVNRIFHHTEKSYLGKFRGYLKN